MKKKLYIKLIPINQVSMLSAQLREVPLDQALCFGLRCSQPGDVCDASCYLSKENKLLVGLEYIVKAGYVSKADALEYTLRLSKQN